MVFFNRLTIRNFKRFSGEHDIDLRGDGRLTIIAADNGIGKTSTMEAIHIALYGKAGFAQLYPKRGFLDWLNASYSIEASGDRHILLALEMEDPILGPVRISRTFWLLNEGDLEEEVGIQVSGKPLQKEPGETRKGLAERWISDFLPQSAMRRFLVDGERLNDLDPQNIDQEIVEGVDDVIGVGLLKRMIRHLTSVKRNTLRKISPDEKEEVLAGLLEMLPKYSGERDKARESLIVLEAQLEEANSRISEIQEEIESLTRTGGSRNAELRIDYAIALSELTSVRREVQELLMGALPFVVARTPSELSEWRLEEVLENKRSLERADSNMSFLREVLDASAPSKKAFDSLIRTGESLSKKEVSEVVDSPLGVLGLSIIEELQASHSSLGLSEAGQKASEVLAGSLEKLEAFERVEERLRDATSGLGIKEKAMELKRLATEAGSLQAEIARLKGEEVQSEENRRSVEIKLEEIRQGEGEDSLYNRRITRADQLIELAERVKSGVRADFAKPLEEAFAEGFELLSRKSGRLESVTIDTSDYSTSLSMRGFEGNWLDRDLSATEKQHVGLALVYALRKVRGNAEWFSPLPVVIDTPTSRMDTEHKNWSVTKFYPQLSNQVIVLATSDDLSGGLFDQLVDSGAIGSQILYKEASENSIEVLQSDLRAFFRK